MGEGGGRAAPLFACQSAQKDGCAQRTGAHARPKPTSILYLRYAAFQGLSEFTVVRFLFFVQSEYMLKTAQN